MYRFAWVGDPDNRERNSGRFALVQLYHVNKCGSYEHPKMREVFWDVDVTMPLDKYFKIERSYRGPIFAKDGTTNRDWDQTFYKPMLMQVFDESWGFSNADVLSGGVLAHIRKRTLTAKEKRKRLYKQAKEESMRLENRIKDLARQMGDEWMWMGNRTGETGDHTMPYEMAKQNLTPNFLKLQNGQLDFSDYYVKHRGLKEET
jgi:hypothetical protein